MTLFVFRGAAGFMLGMSDARDRPVIEQDGYYIAPGKQIDFNFLNLQLK